MLPRLRAVGSHRALRRWCCCAQQLSRSGAGGLPEGNVRSHCGAASAFAGGSLVAATVFSQARADPVSADEGSASVDEAYQILEPVVWSGEQGRQLWERFGVSEASSRWWKKGRVLKPQSSQCYRDLNADDEDRLRDMFGKVVGVDRNPGLRVEPNFVTEEEEQLLVQEVSEIVSKLGSLMGGSRSYASQQSPSIRLVLQNDGSIVPDPAGRPGPMWRVTGRAEDGKMQHKAPWGYGAALDTSALPPGLAMVADRISTLEGYPLGPLRDVTVNLRTSKICRLDPHIDPLEDGPNGFILTLQSGAILTFSPVGAVRADPNRSGNPAEFGMRSYTDKDLDCLLRRRSLCHFCGDARYRWTHAIRPGIVVEMADESGAQKAALCEWWGTKENLLERKDGRISLVFSFADPYTCDKL